MTVRIITGDCRDVLCTLPEGSVDAIVTDPPYHLTAGKKGGTGPASVNLKSPHGRSRVTTGFMGMKWDGGDVAFQPEVWAECLRVLKPGGHLLAFSGTRTYHRMACAIEDAGFEIRDQIGWAYSSGFPKSLNLDRERGDAICGCEPLEGVSAAPERDVRSVFEADVQTPFAVGGERGEVLQPGVSEQGVPTGALQRPASTNRTGELGVERRGDTLQEEGQLRERAVCASAGMGAADGEEGRLHHGAPTGDGRMVRLSPGADGGRASRRSRSDAQLAREPGTVAGQPEPQARGAWPLCRGCGKPILPRGLGTALKPAWEPICMARKPLIGTVAANVLAHGTGALNIDGCRVGTATVQTRVNTAIQGGKFAAGDGRGLTQAVSEHSGRWPANLIHDGSDEVLAAFPDAPGQLVATASNSSSSRKNQNVYGTMAQGSGDAEPRADSGSAARFFKECGWQGPNPPLSDAATAGPSSSLQSVLDASVQSGAAIWPSLAGIVSNDSKEPSTSVTPSESRTIAELAITAMAPIGSESSRESLLEKLSPCGSRVSVAATRDQTGTTTITASLCRSGGFVARATFSITPTCLDRGEVVSRLRYCAKANKDDRGDGNTHPTVKPGDLMRYLCRLVTPPGGTVLDPFTGSGSTLVAADREGFNAIGIELLPEYADIARRRIHRDAPLFAEVS